MSKRIQSAKIPVIKSTPVEPPSPPMFNVFTHYQALRPKLEPFMRRAYDANREAPDHEAELIWGALAAEAERMARQLSEFIEKIINNPLYALSWANGSFETAAQLSVHYTTLSRLVESFNSEYDALPFVEKLNLVIEELRKDVWRGARWPQQSTSPTSNVANQFEVSAKAEMLEKLENFIKFKLNK